MYQEMRRKSHKNINLKDVGMPLLLNVLTLFFLFYKTSTQFTDKGDCM